MPSPALIGSAAAKRRGSSANPSGQAPPSGNLTGWNQLYVQDFNTPFSIGAVSSTGAFPAPYTGWDGYDDTWSDSSTNGQYYPSQVLSVSNSCLDYYIHTSGGIHMTAAPMPPDAAQPGSYGRFVMRFRSDSMHGYKVAWLLWPVSGVWPRDGEIDFPEGDLDSDVGAFMHQQGGTSGADQEGFDAVGSQPFTSWHTATVEWMPNYCKFDLDGNGFGTAWHRVPNTPMYHVLQAETTLSGFVPADAVNGHIQLDWYSSYSFDTAYTPPQTIGCLMATEGATNSQSFTVPRLSNGGVPAGSSDLATGDLLTAVVATWNAASATTPAGWTQIGTAPSFPTTGGPTLTLRTYQRTWDGTTGSYTFAFTGTPYVAGGIFATRGGTFDVYGTQNNTTASTSLTAPSVTCSDADALYYIAVVDSGGATLDRPRQMGWLGFSDSMIIMVEPRMPGATGSRTGSADTPRQSIGTLIAIK